MSNKKQIENEEKFKYYAMKAERDNALQLLFDVLQDNEMVGTTTPPTLEDIKKFMEDIRRKK